MVYPSNYPVIDGDDVWIYYAGLKGNFSDGEGHACVGRARTRLGGFAKRELDAGSQSRSFTTAPFELPIAGKTLDQGGSLGRGYRHCAARPCG
jgi:hypothetical protein